MKKILIYTILFILFVISFGFKSKNNSYLNKALLCKTWKTSAKDDAASIVIITFNNDNSYSHEYVTENMPKKDKLIMFGKWAIDDDKKIHITFNKSKIKDDFEIVSIKENELVLKTVSGIKKFEILKNK